MWQIVDLLFVPVSGVMARKLSFLVYKFNSLKLYPHLYTRSIAYVTVIVGDFFSSNHLKVQWDFTDITRHRGNAIQRIILVMGNLSTHTGASLYKSFEPQIARRLLEKLKFVDTPKHGSWLNMAECEFSVLSRQCLSCRLPDRDTVRSGVNAWTVSRNQAGGAVNWRFTTEDARIKLKRLYPITADVN
jgi:hypothetical protein